MDFNTGASGSGGSSPPPQNRPNAPGGGSEFGLSNPVQSFINTVRGVVLNPVGFFRGMQKSGDFINPLVFTLICAVIGGIVSGVIAFLSGLLFGDILTAFVQLILQPVFFVIATVIGLFIGAGILHLFVMLFVKPSNTEFETTYRVVAYLGTLYLVSGFAAIPILGILLGLVITAWYLVLAVLGIREAHTTTTGRAAAAVLIPTVILFILILLLIALVGLAIFAGSQSGF